MRIGKGGDKDELNTVYIYDSHIFPFHRAEQYHQFYKVPPCPLHVSLALARCSVSCSVSSSPFFFLSSCWLAVTHAAGARGCQSGAREPRTHRTHWLPGAGTPLFSLGLNHQLLSTRLSVAIAAKQGQEWQYGTKKGEPHNIAIRWGSPFFVVRVACVLQDFRRFCIRAQPVPMALCSSKSRVQAAQKSNAA